MARVFTAIEAEIVEGNRSGWIAAEKADKTNISTNMDLLIFKWTSDEMGDFKCGVLSNRGQVAA